ncbi:cysteine desulfurase [bacterium]|nr:cysteine desulfurase [bacterium]
MSFDINQIKNQFPLLKGNPDLVYLDSASTTHKPKVVLNAMNDFYISSNANVHRGLYDLSHKADTSWIDAHRKVAQFINALPEEVFFVKNATEGINWFAQTARDQILKEGDVVVITQMEHHSNILPWSAIQQRLDIQLERLMLNKDSRVDLDHLTELFGKYGERIKIISLAHMSNVLGVTNDVKSITKLARKYGAMVLVDGTQSVAHLSVDVKELDCDIFVFSGHKMYGPTGIGVVYGKRNILENLDPVWQGGEMVDNVSENVVFKNLPWKFEAGTPNIAGGIGLAKAAEWLNSIEGRFEYEKELSNYLYLAISKHPSSVKVLSQPSSILSFVMDGVHAHDIASEFNELGICIRSGYHCAQPLHEKLKIKGSARVSLGIYNTKGDVDKFIQGLDQLKRYE